MGVRSASCLRKRTIWRRIGYSGTKIFLGVVWAEVAKIALEWFQSTANSVLDCFFAHLTMPVRRKQDDEHFEYVQIIVSLYSWFGQIVLSNPFSTRIHCEMGPVEPLETSLPHKKRGRPEKRRGGVLE